MVIIRGRDKGLTGWRPGRRSQPRPPEHTPWTPVFLSPSAKQGKGWTERPGSCACRLASPRLVSFLLDLGKLPKLDLGVLANDEHPGSSLCWTICATFEIHTVELEDNHSRPLHRTIITHPLPAHISFHATRGHFSLCLLLRLTSISFNHNTASERPPNQPCQPTHGPSLSHSVSERPDSTIRLSWARK